MKNLFDLTGRTALVTGGSRGLGLQIAEGLGEYGAKVVLTSRKQADLDEAVAHLKARGIHADAIAADLSNPTAVAGVVERLTSAGAVGAVGNRRALRIGAEPLDLFRRYCSAYSRDQAYCYVSPALIANLERNWDAQNRKV